MENILRIRPEDRTQETDQTAGMIREAAIHFEGVWAGYARVPPGWTTGWHLHENWNTIAYVRSGAIRLDFGPGGTESVEAEPGDFVFVPKGMTHRESNPSADEQVLIVFRIGVGPAATEATRKEVADQVDQVLKDLGERLSKDSPVGDEVAKALDKAAKEVTESLDAEKPEATQVVTNVAGPEPA